MGAEKRALIDVLKAQYPARDEKELFAAILRGGVHVEGERVMKPGTPVALDARLVLRPGRRFVSRGGEKLAAALDAWDVPCAGRTWLDAGCSTGGFTDCLLQRGAACVHAVDVGVGQLDPRLRADPRVRALEGTNVMAVAPGDLDPPPDWAAADLSFRSLRRAAARILSLTREGRGIFLVKPQFEYRDAPADFRGVVHGTGALRAILGDLLGALAAEGVAAERAMASPLKGRKGNSEFLFLLRVGSSSRAEDVLDGLVAE